MERYIQGRVCQQLQGTRGDQGAQTELRNPGSLGSNSGDESNNKGIDMQSFGAMTGADPLAVKEIEQLMFNSQTSLKEGQIRDERNTLFVSSTGNINSAD